ncbi:UNVERIFIED_CONTAM: hypothetical protein RMT77_010850 [Armadillidium vulgare]
MNLLPKSSKNFSSKQYWNEFFTKRGVKSFEWYGEYTELCGLLLKYMKKKDKILVAGCGSSSISADLYKSGFQQITNVDISEIVIRQMKDRYQTEYKEMDWIQGDLFNMSFESEMFSCILDKGTLDAIMSDDSEESASRAKLYFQELGRVLSFGGRYICISLLQEHILTSLLNWFPEHGWFMRFCRCQDAEKSKSEQESFSFPVFVIVCTKLKCLKNFEPVIELNLEEGEINRTTSSEVKETVTSLQQFALLKHNLKKKLVAGENINLDLYDPKNRGKRYELFVVDAPKTSNKLPFAVFIVPHGRESEWLFSNIKGQRQLAESASANRLVVVHLMRGQIYGTMKDVQNELESKVLELAPLKLPNDFKIPFLSAGNDLGERKEVFKGKSHFSGEFVVEDVKEENPNSFLRRLIFLQNQNAIQSEARFTCDTKRKKKKSSVPHFTLDYTYLVCAHHLIMLTAYEITPKDGSTLLIGLGGGALATFIHKYFPKISIIVVDIDEEIVKVAKSWFNFKTDSNLKCVVDDGINYIEKACDEERKVDVIMFDVDSKELSEGLSCPPKPFVDKEFLKKVARCLTERGLFVLNLVCRDDALRELLFKDLKEVFSSIVYVSVPEEVNVIVFCKCSPTLPSSSSCFEETISKLNKYLISQMNSKDDVLSLSDMLKNFHVL